MIEKGSESLLLKAQPLEQAERICNSMAEVCVVDGDTLLLAADPAWAQAINSVLVKKGVRVSELCSSSAVRQCEGQGLAASAFFVPIHSPSESY